MRTQTIVCPKCNHEMRANVPDPPGEYGVSALLGFTDSTTRCPNCGARVCVRVGSGGGIRKIFIEPVCLLATTCCSARGLADDCEELEAARALRDNWLIFQPSGDKVIASYYRLAPRILDSLQQNLQAEAYTKLFERAFTDYIVPSTSACRQDDFARAYRLLGAMVKEMAAVAEIDLDAALNL